MESPRHFNLIKVTDRTFELHRGGKIYTGLKVPLKTRDDLSMAYTPGVARVCNEIAADRDKAFSVHDQEEHGRLVSDGTAVLGLGDIGPEAAMPVMEGKAMLFKEFADVDAFPICLDSKDPDEIVQAVKLIAPELRRDQPRGHLRRRAASRSRTGSSRSSTFPSSTTTSTARRSSCWPRFFNACRLTGRAALRPPASRWRARAPPVWRSRSLLMDAGVASIVACDRYGSIHGGRGDYESGEMNAPKTWLAENTNPERRETTLGGALEGTDVFIGLSGPG